MSQTDDECNKDIERWFRYVLFLRTSIPNVVGDIKSESHDDNDAHEALDYLKKLCSKNASHFYFRVKSEANHRIQCII